MAFKCVECNRTFPDKDNQMDDPNKYSNEGLCPDCHEEEDDDSGGRFADRMGSRPGTKVQPEDAMTTLRMGGTTRWRV
jgi:hypothetical protein